MSLKKRKELYFELSTPLAQLGPQELKQLLRKSLKSQGWGSNHIASFRGQKIFIKKIPLTQFEFEHAHSTKNIFQLPTFYNYGIGSAGFGAFRELSAHIKTTNWVLNNEMLNFPLMYHYRIVAKTQNEKPIRKIRHRDYLKRWNNDRKIDQFIRARQKADYEIVLFLEYFPFTASTWLPDNTDQWGVLLRDVKKVTDFFRSQNFLHFDLHLGNILVDGQKAYITDFGLCIDRDFELSQREKVFFEKHLARNYDFNSFIGALGSSVFTIYQRLPRHQKNQIKNLFGISPLAPASEDATTSLPEFKCNPKNETFESRSNVLGFSDQE